MQTLASYPLKKFTDYSTGGETIQQFDAQPDVAAVYAENNLITRPAPTVPVFQYHAALDEIVPIGQASALNQAWCAAGVRTVFTVVPGDHIAGRNRRPARRDRLALRPVRRTTRTDHLPVTPTLMPKPHPPSRDQKRDRDNPNPCHRQPR